MLLEDLQEKETHHLAQVRVTAQILFLISVKAFRRQWVFFQNGESLPKAKLGIE